MKKLIALVIVSFLSFSLFAQNKDKKALKKELSEIKSEIKKLKKKASAVQEKIDKQYGWKIKAFGTIGIDLSNFNNWYANSKPNLSSGNINIIQNVYAKLNREQYFWLSYLNLKLDWKKSYNRDKDLEDKGFDNKKDIFNIGSLFGYKLSKNFSVSTLMEYRGSFIKDFADPSFIDLGLGMAWRPIEDLYIVANPLSYEAILSGSDKKYQSSMGAKFLADYTHSFGKFNVNSNLTAFISYRSSNLSAWTWKNSFSYSFWKGLGLSFNFGLKQNKQEQFNSKLTSYPSLNDAENTLQSFWMFGLSYAL